MYFINYLTFLYWCGFYTPFHSLPLYLLLIQGFEILQYFHSFFKSVWWQKIKFLRQLPWQSCHDNSEVSEFITNFFLGYIEIIYKFNLDQEFVIINSKKKKHTKVQDFWWALTFREQCLCLCVEIIYTVKSSVKWEKCTIIIAKHQYYLKSCLVKHGFKLFCL